MQTFTHEQLVELSLYPKDILQKAMHNLSNQTGIVDEFIYLKNECVLLQLNPHERESFNIPKKNAILTCAQRLQVSQTSNPPYASQEYWAHFLAFVAPIKRTEQQLELKPAPPPHSLDYYKKS